MPWRKNKNWNVFKTSVWSKTQDLQELTHYLWQSQELLTTREAIFCTISALQWNNFLLCDPKPSPGQAVHMQATAKLAREPLHRKLESSGNFHLQECKYHAVPLGTYTSFFSLDLFLLWGAAGWGSMGSPEPCPQAPCLAPGSARQQPHGTPRLTLTPSCRRCCKSSLKRH